MKHATNRALDELENLLLVIRSYSELREKKRGIFYRKSTAFLHFHEDTTGLFADLRVDGDFVRFAVNTAAERRQFAAAVKRSIGA
jgi:hypothetical protein